MKSNVLTVDPETALLDAWSMMKAAHVRHLPVVDDSASLKGLVTRAHILAIIGPRQSSEDQRRGVGRTVGDVMTETPLTIGPKDTVERAALIMLDKKVSGLPVVEDGNLVGIITQTNIFRVFVEMMGLTESGARITFDFKDGQGLVRELKEHLDTFQLRSLVTHYDSESGQWEAVLRVGGLPQVGGDTQLEIDIEDG